MLATIVTRFVGALRWLARQTYRQRALGVAGSSTPQLSRLLDLHAITVAAHLALVAALLLAPPSPTLIWIAALIGGTFLSGLAIWRSGRLFVALLIAAELLLSILAIRWHDFLPYLIALAFAQQAALFAVWIRNGASLSVLGRATSYGALLGIFTGGATLIIGVFARPVPLWTAAILFAIAALLSLRIPVPTVTPTPTSKPAPAPTSTPAPAPTSTPAPAPTSTSTPTSTSKSTPASTPPRPPRQGGTTQPPAKPQTPEGYSVYRPSSLDDKRDA